MNTIRWPIAYLTDRYYKLERDTRLTMMVVPIVAGCVMFIISGAWQLNSGNWTFLTLFPKAILAAVFAFMMLNILLWFFFLFYALSAAFFQYVSNKARSPNK